MGSYDFVSPPCEMVDCVPDVRGIGRIEVSFVAGADGDAEASQLVHHVANLLAFTAEDALKRLALDGIFSACMLVFHIFFK